MSTVTFQPADETAVRYIARRLRAADRVELAITNPGETAEDILLAGWKSSRWATVAYVDGKPALVYGVSPTNQPGVGSCWMLATERIRRIRRFFVEHCRGEVELMRQSFPVLYNRVHRDNVCAIAWLEWLGFTINRARPVGPNGALLEFWKGDIRHV